ncbi:hypothetical protein JD844_001404 [Phrynosoma platyrhinos]|uniref:Mpv17-like protein n=1 Tax=Phrynosoma platyrhinos TaxID=52577 RepID=A0ABQ7T9U1_PHRPL|nr:hypothetical protein JD844_001404 [Phrynosoma platyrhinos]
MRSILSLVHRHPWVLNIAAYGTLFSLADVAQQVLSGLHQDQLWGTPLDLKQTAKVALVGFTFHANFNYVWFRTLERLLPGANVTRVIIKVACDQAIAAPITIGAFYTVNFTLVPPMLRTAYVGACSFVWTAFLCYLRQSNACDPTSQLFRAVPGLAQLFPPTAQENQMNRRSEK